MPADLRVVSRPPAPLVVRSLFPDSWFTQKGRPVVQRPSRFNAIEFAVLSGLRAAQLARGCTPRVICAEKVTVTAQMEIAEGKIVRDLTPLPPQ
jgi:DNA-directed RNA polymerase subunit K/omega